MPIILSIETSTDVCSVSAHKGGKLISYFELHVEKSHSQSITGLIQQILYFSKLSFQDIDAIALSKGPGSYTGLRVGTSTAKGIALALDKPLIAINTLEAMAEEVRVHNGYLLCPMIDARRMEVYSAVFNNKMETLELTKAVILTELSFQEFYSKGKMLFFGNGSYKLKEILHHPNVAFLDNIYPKASSIGKLAQSQFLMKNFEDVHNFEPFYLKEFVSNKPI